MFSEYNAAATRIQGLYIYATVSSLFPSSLETIFRRDIREEKDRVLLIDIECGHGQVLKKIRRSRPDLVGRMIVQDLLEIIAGRPAADEMENMVYNFLEPQSVKGKELSSLSYGSISVF